MGLLLIWHSFFCLIWVFIYYFSGTRCPVPLSYNYEKVDYKGPYVFDSIKQQNILIPENMYSDIINFIKEKTEEEEIIYF